MQIFSRVIRSKQTSQAGFGLIEVMVAMAIFVVGILGCYKMQLHATKSNAMANRVSTSANWAAYEIEELLGKDYSHADLNDDGTGSSGSAGLDDIGANADGAIYVQPDGSKLAISSGNDLYSVSWNVVEGTATEKSVLRDVKQMRVHVVRNGGIGALPGGAPLYTHDYFKTAEF